MNCINIVKKYLKENGFDGLYFPGECACKIEDLAPCDEDFSNCIPGYLHPGDDESDFYIKQEPHNKQINSDRVTVPIDKSNEIEFDDEWGD